MRSVTKVTPRTLSFFVFFALASTLTYTIWIQNCLALTHISWDGDRTFVESTTRALTTHSLAIHSLLISTPSLTPSLSTPVSTPVSAPSQSTPSLSKNPTPKITIIAIWTPRHGELNYLPYFFQSVEANPKVNLVFVNVVSHQNGCKIHSNATNIQELCMNEKDYYELHVAFLCKQWACSDTERNALYERIFSRRDRDYNYSFFRILRSGIFGQWIDPATTIWGWCDLDTFWGNFERTFPWDLAPNYDIIAVTSQPDIADQRLLFTRGHMAFFRHTSGTLQKLHAYPPFASLQAFLASSLRADAEESQFSHYYFAKNDAFTYLHVEGMIDPPATILISDKGTFYLDLRKHEFTLQIRQKLLSIIAAAHAQSTSTSEGLAADGSYAFPSFTSTGIQKHSPVKTVGFRGWFWFPEEYVAYYEPGWVIGEREHKAYFMRDAERGPTAQRLEPRDRYLLDRGGLSVNEGLYKHFQAEKYFAWFGRFPAARLGPGHTMVHYGRQEGEIWDGEGHVVFETGKDEK